MFVVLLDCLDLDLSFLTASLEVDFSLFTANLFFSTDLPTLPLWQLFDLDLLWESNDMADFLVADLDLSLDFFFFLAGLLAFVDVWAYVLKCYPIAS